MTRLSLQSDVFSSFGSLLKYSNVLSVVLILKKRLFHEVEKEVGVRFNLER